MSALIKAVNKNDLSEVRALIKSGADVNAKDEYGYTALIRASVRGNIEVVKLLLKKGADVNAKNNNGDTALMKASNRRYTEVVRILIKAGADVHAKDTDGKTALIWACRYGNTELNSELVKLLIKAGATCKGKKILSFGFRKNLGENKRTVIALKTEKEIIFFAGCFEGNIDELKLSIIGKYGFGSEYEKEVVSLFNELNR